MGPDETPPSSIGTLPGRTQSRRVRVRWGEVDSAGRVFYPNYFSWMGEATLSLFKGPGRSFASMFQSGVGVPVIASAIHFEQPALYDDLLTVHATVAEVRESTFRVEHVVTREETAIARGHEVRALVELDSAAGGRLRRRRISGQLRRWLEESAGPADAIEEQAEAAE